MGEQIETNGHGRLTPAALSQDVEGLTFAVEPSVVTVAPGGTFDLRVHPVAKRIGDSVFRMLSYNGTIPGSTLRVRRGSEVLVNVTNETEPTFEARAGEVVRLFLTNKANTRVFRVAVEGSRMKLVGGDGGRYDLVWFDVAEPAAASAAAGFENLRVDDDMTRERARAAAYLEAAPEREDDMLEFNRTTTPGTCGGASRDEYDDAEFFLGKVDMPANVGTYIDSPSHRSEEQTCRRSRWRTSWGCAGWSSTARPAGARASSGPTRRRHRGRGDLDPFRLGPQLGEGVLLRRRPGT